jgi:cysteine desulfurase / selenocysteine lyase
VDCGVDEPDILQPDLCHVGGFPAVRKIVALAHQSNVLGTVNPVRTVTAKAHEFGALVLLDAAQSVPHMPVDVRELGADFLVFSGHKMLGPTGIGVLAAREEVLEGMQPFLGGGSMIADVQIDGSTFADIPARFEAGVPNIAEAVGLHAAVDYLSALGMDRVTAYERFLTERALERLGEVDGLRLLGPGDTEQRGGVLSFTLGDVHPHDVAQVLDAEGVAVRAGHHCAKPLMRRLGVQATTRATLYLYNTVEEVDILAEALGKAQAMFAR